MATVTQLMLIADDRNFQNRVKYYLQKYAVTVMAEPGNTPDHAARVLYAGKVLDGTASIYEYVVGVLTNPTIAAQANGAVPPDWSIDDANIEFQGNTIFNAYAGIALAVV
jgi:hypothetical protein